MEAVGKFDELPLQKMLNGVVDAVLDYSKNHTFDDDVCLLGADLGKLAAD